MSAVEQAATVMNFKDWLPALVGIGGVIVGSILQVAGQICIKAYDQRKSNIHEEKQKEMLIEMLSDKKFEWRNFETLSRVIGADDETTRRLLIEAGARGDQRPTGKWALIEDQPLKNMPDNES